MTNKNLLHQKVKSPQSNLPPHDNPIISYQDCVDVLPIIDAILI